MKQLWCWRCKCVVPMLESEEWAKIQAIDADYRNEFV